MVPKPPAVESLVVPVGTTTITLGAKQLLVARMIIANGRARGMGDRAVKVALMTAFQESKLRMYANSTIPESLKYPHDAVGNDHDSLNFFQQRVRYWGTVAQLMNPDYAISAFYVALSMVPGWESLPPGVAAQRVQVSAFPDAYAQWEGAADTLIAFYPPPGVA